MATVYDIPMEAQDGPSGADTGTATPSGVTTPRQTHELPTKLTMNPTANTNANAIAGAAGAVVKQDGKKATDVEVKNKTLSEAVARDRNVKEQKMLAQRRLVHFQEEESKYLFLVILLDDPCDCRY